MEPDCTITSELERCLRTAEAEVALWTACGRGPECIRVVLAAGSPVVILDNTDETLPDAFWRSYDSQKYPGDQLQLQGQELECDTPDHERELGSGAALELQEGSQIGNEPSQGPPGSDALSDQSISYSDTGGDSAAAYMDLPSSFPDPEGACCLLCPCCPETLLLRVASYNELPLHCHQGSSNAAGVVVYWCAAAVRTRDNGALALAAWMCSHHGWRLHVVVRTC
jgi:hypothetical protein